VIVREGVLRRDLGRGRDILCRRISQGRRRKGDSFGAGL
jgi:hypothetical protein